jgi:FKBP-type peptidyl-prolyl cis-trans isomerase FkpA
MKHLSLFLIVIGLSFACSTDNTIDTTISVEEQLAIDIALIDNWLADSSITNVLQHPTEIRYTVNKQGTGLEAQVADVLRVKYEGRFLDTGVVFDSNESFDFVLNSGSIILGWFYMLQEMREGDEFTIYIPSKYAYGTRGNRSIPPNTVIVFDIELIRVGN